jgi:hypothetical protein
MVSGAATTTNAINNAQYLQSLAVFMAAPYKDEWNSSAMIRCARHVSLTWINGVRGLARPRENTPIELICETTHTTRSRGVG